MKGLGLGRLKNLDPKTTSVVATSGSAPEHDPMSTSNKAARFERRRQPHHGDRRQGSSEVLPGYEKVHVAIDDATRCLRRRARQTSRKGDNRWLPGRAVRGWFLNRGSKTCRRILSEQRPLLIARMTARKACRFWI